MGFVAERRNLSLSVFIPTAAYGALVWATAWKHEPWADEAQTWLIARDSSFFELWTRLLHYEGTPGLWHSLLWVVSRMGLSYSFLNFVSSAFGIAAAYLVFRYAPFLLPIRLLLPFTYFLAYQYAVIARSYVLLPPLLFGIAVLYPQRERRWALYLVLLCALALCSLHGLVLSAVIAVTTFRHRALVVFAVVAGFGMWCAFPATDVTFVRHLNYSASHLFEKAASILSEAFADNALASAILIALSVPFLWRGRTLLLFLLSGLSLMIVMAVVYGQVWHFGTVFLAWVLALWIAAVRTRPGWLASSAFFAVLVIHCVWTVRSISEEVQTAYSGALSTAKYLQEHHLPEAGIYALGYASVAVQPYFGRNIFVNFRHGFWDWSSKNHMIRDYDKLGELRPPWVLVGYKTDEENYLWNSQVRRSGYRRVQHFEGNLIWKGEAFEPESFDLYQRR